MGVSGRPVCLMGRGLIHCLSSLSLSDISLMLFQPHPVTALGEEEFSLFISYGRLFFSFQQITLARISELDQCFFLVGLASTVRGEVT